MAKKVEVKAVKPGEGKLAEVNPFDQVSCKMRNSVVEDPSFTGVARSMICVQTNNQFQNFQIATLYIEDGKVWKMELSDRWAQWEAGSFMDEANYRSLIDLNNNWKDGQAFKK
jgi:hypothetical protein